jgi:hypothetical protein
VATVATFHSQWRFSQWQMANCPMTAKPETAYCRNSRSIRPGFIIEGGVGRGGLRLCFAALALPAFAGETAGAGQSFQ